MLECKLKWALGSITTNKARGGDGLSVELFQILKYDAVKVLHSICQQIWKTQLWPQGWKRSVFIPIPKKGNAKGCSKVKMKVKLLSHVQFFGTPWTVAHQAPPLWDSAGKNTGVDCHFLLQGIFPTQGSNPGLLHCRQML